MWPSKLYQHWLAGNTRGRRSATLRRRGLRLTLEQLEDRTVPSSFTAASVSDLIADINAANASGGANTITLVAGTTFNLTAVNNTTDGATGLPVIAANDNLSIVGNSAVIQRSTANGTPAFRLFDVASGASLALANMTLQGGSAPTEVIPGPVTFATGGGIFSQGSLSLNGVTVQNNIAQVAPGDPATALGGGIYSSGSLTVNASTIQNNQATAPAGYTGDNAMGGGIYSSGSLTVNASTIQNNQALGTDGRPGIGGADGAGGGLFVIGTASLTNVTLYGNTAQGGNGGNAFTICFGKQHDCHKFPGGNGGNGLGGGMYVGSGATVSLHNCTVTQNSAIGGKGGTDGGIDGLGEGGGLYLANLASVCLDAFTVANVVRNKASTSGKDIYGPYTICP